MSLIKIYRTVTPKKIRAVVGKLFYNKLYANKSQSKMFPHIAIELNTSCTRRCSYCPNSIYDRGLIKNEKLMKEQLFKKIINELSADKYFGIVNFSFYGEPLLDKRLPRLVKYTREKLPNANLQVTTNGDLLNLDLYKKLAEAKIDKILITRHDPTVPEGVK
ncbi:radical SAM protein, partial [Candidatus Woesearchaeota archaeon]|nr:radical SAM protein [Candidatus Woesearchaeota archaeon]